MPRNSNFISPRGFPWTFLLRANRAVQEPSQNIWPSLAKASNKWNIAVPMLTAPPKILKEKFGVAAVYPAVRHGADGTRVNFFLVVSPDGGKVLIETVRIAVSRITVRIL